MKSEGIQTNLEGTEVQIAMRTCVIVVGRGLSEEGCGTVASCLIQHCLCQLEHKVCGGLARLVWYGRHCLVLPLVSVTQVKYYMMFEINCVKLTNETA